MYAVQIKHMQITMLYYQIFFLIVSLVKQIKNRRVNMFVWLRIWPTSRRQKLVVLTMWARYTLWQELLCSLSGWFPVMQLNMYSYCQWWQGCGSFLIYQTFFMFIFFFLLILAWLPPASFALSWSSYSQVAFGCFISRIYIKNTKDCK